MAILFGEGKEVIAGVDRIRLRNNFEKIRWKRRSMKWGVFWGSEGGAWRYILAGGCFGGRGKKGVKNTREGWTWIREALLLVIASFNVIPSFSCLESQFTTNSREYIYDI